jgi:hypothetical protein
MPALRNAAGVVIGACDSMPLSLSFDRQGRRPWRMRQIAAAAADTNVEMDAPKMQDALGPWYKRLP